MIWAGTVLLVRTVPAFSFSTAGGTPLAFVAGLCGLAVNNSRLTA